jgi:phosphoribosylpyrophosphate synthetase
MSLSQIHELDKIVQKRRRELRRDMKILEIKKNIYNKIQIIVDDVIDTFSDIYSRFFYENKNLAYAKKR